MKRTLCFFVIALSVCVYPVFLQVPYEITNVFGLVEIDLFSWYRMWLVTLVGGGLLLCTINTMPGGLLAYWALLLASVAHSMFFRTALFGAPWMHEGEFAILGYVGLYLAAKKYGLFKDLEKALSTVIVIAFIVSLMQIIWGNPMLAPPIKWLVPNFKYEIKNGYLSSVFGHWNHLGLFCALFYPYAVLKKKYAVMTLVLFMAIGSLSRGAWVSIAITSLLMDRKKLVYIVPLAICVAVPFHKELLPRVRATLSDRTLSGRTYIWKKSSPQLKHTILIGNGPGNYGMYFPQHETFASVVDRPHNIYLSTWASTGLISMILLFGGIAVILLNGRNPALEMGCIGFLICGLFTDSVLSVTPYFVIFLGALSHKEDWRIL